MGENISIAWDALLARVQNLAYQYGNSSEIKPSCSNDKFDSGHIAFMLTASALVFFMTLPGLMMTLINIASQAMSRCNESMQQVWLYFMAG